MFRNVLLAGASVLALGVSSAGAATVFQYDGMIDSFTAPTTGLYEVAALGAAGGGSSRGGYGAAAGGGGGGSYLAPSVLGGETLRGVNGGDGVVLFEAVPEPSTRSLLLGGFGLVEFLMRRRFLRAT